MFGRAKRPADIESGLKDLSSPEVLDFDDDSWVIDHHRNNLIEKISKPGNTCGYDCVNFNEDSSSTSSTYDTMLRSQPDGQMTSETMRLRTLGAATSGTITIHDEFNFCYLAVQALRDHDYMCQHIWQPNDPFYVTGERYVERMMLQSAMRGMEHDVDPLRWAKSRRAWTTASDKPVPIGGTRDGNYWEAWFAGFRRRLGVAAVGAAFLIAPMWLMVLRRTLYTALVSTTVFVAVFGLLMALWLEKLTEVMSATAAYAAVLVVFVGLTTDSG